MHLRLDTHDEFAELVDRFNRMAASLAQTEAMRVRLLGDVSYELKTPLAGIKGYMEGLKDGVPPATPATFDLIQREADRLQDWAAQWFLKPQLKLNRKRVS